MSLYIGGSTTDANFILSGEEVVRSVKRHENTTHAWPLYEFSFYDGRTQKCNDNIPAAGDSWTVDMRSCEDSFWHKLNFNFHYVCDQNDKLDWLPYLATELVTSNNRINWIEITNSTTANVSPSAGDNAYQHIDFNETYASIDDINGCKSNKSDSIVSYKIYPNEWFTERSGRMYARQFNEWFNAYDTPETPSDNLPTIFFTQVANEWSSPIQIELVDTALESNNLVCGPGPYGHGTHTELTKELKFKIYGDTTAGSRIYYGDNIASNHGTVDQFGEIVKDGYMWITYSGGGLNNVSTPVYNTSTKTWSCIVTWNSNNENQSHASTSMSITGGSTSIPADGGSTTISASCTHTTQARNGVININLSNKNNWKQSSLRVPTKQLGDRATHSISQSVSFSPVPSGEKNYFISGPSAVGPASEQFTLISYSTTDSSSGDSESVSLSCPCCGNSVSTTVSQDSAPATAQAEQPSLRCTNCDITADSSNEGTYEYTYTIDVHKDADGNTNSGVNGTVTCTNGDGGSSDGSHSGATHLITHISEEPEDEFYTINMFLTQNYDIPAASSDAYIFTGTATETKIVKDKNGNIKPEKSYYDRDITKTSDTQAKITDFTMSFTTNDFRFVDAPVVNNDSITIKLQAEQNNSTGDTTYEDNVYVEITDPGESTIGSSTGSTAGFEVHTYQREYRGGKMNIGTCTFSYGSQSLSCYAKQPSVVATEYTGATRDAPDKIVSLSINDSANFSIPASVKTSLNNAKAWVTITARTDCEASKNTTISRYTEYRVKDGDEKNLFGVAETSWDIEVEAKPVYTKIKLPNDDEVTNRSETVTASATNSVTNTKTQTVREVKGTTYTDVSDYPALIIAYDFSTKNTTPKYIATSSIIGSTLNITCTDDSKVKTSGSDYCIVNVSGFTDSEHGKFPVIWSGELPKPKKWKITAHYTVINNTSWTPTYTLNGELPSATQHLYSIDVTQKELDDYTFKLEDREGPTTAIENWKAWIIIQDIDTNKYDLVTTVIGAKSIPVGNDSDVDIYVEYEIKEKPKPPIIETIYVQIYGDTALMNDSEYLYYTYPEMSRWILDSTNLPSDMYRIEGPNLYLYIENQYGKYSITIVSAGLSTPPYRDGYTPSPYPLFHIETFGCNPTLSGGLYHPTTDGSTNDYYTTPCNFYVTNGDLEINIYIR